MWMRSTHTVAMFLLACWLFAQPDTTWVEYHGGMDLKEGVYFDAQAFRMDRPSVPMDRLRDEQGLPITDIRTVVSKLYWQPDGGSRQAIRMDRLWGFCQNDVVYVHAGNGFYRIGQMGSLAHMVYQQNYRDWDPYLYGYGTVTRTVLQQQLVDVANGQLLPFNAAGIEQALRSDPVLHEEFNALSKKLRNSPEVHFRFLRLYNERHPLRFPR
jgi:hypothetical protein